MCQRTTPRINAGCDLSDSGPFGGLVLVYSTMIPTGFPAVICIVPISSTVP